METNKEYKTILAIKLPANVKNEKKAIEKLGGYKLITSKNIKNENLDLNLFLKNIQLEKTACNDILLKRKTKRNKKDPNKIKIEYSVIGQINEIYECNSMNDFYYSNPYQDLDINDLQKFCINKEDFDKQLKASVTDDIEEPNNVPFTKRVNIIQNIEENINKKINGDKLNKEIDSYFQPKQFANLRFSYPKQIKEIQEDINLLNDVNI